MKASPLLTFLMSKLQMLYIESHVLFKGSPPSLTARRLVPYKLKELLDKREQGLLLSLPKRAREESEEGAGAGLQLQDAGILLHVDEFSFCFLQARDRQSLFANRH